MENPLNRRDLFGLLANVVFVIGMAAVANAIVFSLNWDDSSPATGRVSFAPPGYVVGGVWVLLFAFMGVARWLVVRAGGEEATSRARLVTLLAVFCFLYPFYTLGLTSNVLGLVGNVATILLAGWVALRIKRSSATAALLVSAIIVWVSFATAIVVREIQLGG